MKVAKMRLKLSKLGLMLYQNQQGFTVTDDSKDVHSRLEEKFKNLVEVERWFTDYTHRQNRLTTEDCNQWDRDWTLFVKTQNFNAGGRIGDQGRL